MSQLESLESQRLDIVYFILAATALRLPKCLCTSEVTTEHGNNDAYYGILFATKQQLRQPARVASLISFCLAKLHGTAGPVLQCYSQCSLFYVQTDNKICIYDDLTCSKAHLSHGINASTSRFSTVDPHQIRMEGGASR